MDVTWTTIEAGSIRPLWHQTTGDVKRFAEAMEKLEQQELLKREQTSSVRAAERILRRYENERLAGRGPRR